MPSIWTSLRFCCLVKSKIGTFGSLVHLPVCLSTSSSRPDTGLAGTGLFFDENTSDKSVKGK